MGYAKIVKGLCLSRQIFLPWSVFIVGAALIVFPWLTQPGYLLLLDYVWTPNISAPAPASQANNLNTLIWQWVWWVLSFILPAALIQKIALSVPFLISGLSMFYLTRWIGQRLFLKPGLLPAYCAGIFYATNSFVFVRVAMGHLYLLLAYTLMPLVLLSVLQAIERGGYKRSFVAGSIAVLPMLTSAHHYILVPLLLIFFVRIPRLYTPIRQSFLRAALFLFPLALIAGVSLAFYVQSPAHTQALNPAGPLARALLAPYSGNLLLDTATLTATWKIDLPVLFPYESMSLFGPSITIVLILSLVGLIHLWLNQEWRWLSYRFFLVLAVSAVFAVGVASKATEPIASFLYNYVPFWVGMRDSAKFISLIALIESVLIAVGIWATLQHIRKYATAHLSERKHSSAKAAYPPRRIGAPASMVSDPPAGGEEWQARSLGASRWTSENERGGCAAEGACLQVSEQFRKYRLAHLALSGAYVILFLYMALPTFAGFNGQLYPLNYPASWYEWNTRLVAQKPVPKALFLPWHMYVAFEFTDGRTIANPAPKFFTNAEIVSGDNSEVGGTFGRPFIYTESTRPFSQKIERLLSHTNQIDHFGRELAGDGIQYIMLAKDAKDAHKYSFLYRQDDLEIMFERDDLVVWKNTALLP